jgi:hypothetical protein
MPSDGYQVMLGELRDAAAAYKAQGEAVRQALARFEPAFRLPDTVFGNVPNSRTLASQCQEALERIRSDLTRMQEGLATGAVKLAASAETYKAADDVVEFYSWLAPRRPGRVLAAEADAAGGAGAEFQIGDLVGGDQDGAALVIGQREDAAVSDRGGQDALHLIGRRVGLKDQFPGCPLNSDLDFHGAPSSGQG